MFNLTPKQKQIFDFINSYTSREDYCDFVVRGKMDKDKIKKAVNLFLEAIGENPERPGIQETPARVARMCEIIFMGLGREPAEVLTILRE